MKKLLFFWSKITSTFWFIPVFIILIAISLAVYSVFLDSKFEFPHAGIARFLFIGSVESARSVLSTIAGAMIGVAGTVFSITLVALTLASSQLGPRLVKNFMYDRLNQVVLGIYISTFIYCLIILNTISGDQTAFIPTFSIMLALVAAVANIILLIIFIHHIAMSIQADKVISNISESLSKSIRVLYPEKIGKDSPPEKKEDESTFTSAYSIKQSVQATKTGYIQYLDGNSLFGLADDLDILIEIYFRPGDYLLKGMEIAKIFTNEIQGNEIVRKVQANFFAGKTRTPEQDIEYAIHQMVEIAVRALSPGINDPFTAISCIDNLTSTLVSLSDTKFPSRYRFNEKGELRLIADLPDFEGMLDAAFNQIRQFAEGSPAVVIRLMESLITINNFSKRENDKIAIIKHAKMVLNMAKNSFTEPNDLRDLEERSKIIII